MEKIKIRQATKTGYIEVGMYGCFDYSYPESKLRRGRVQGGGQICPTLTTTPLIAVIVPYRSENEQDNSCR